MRRFSILVLVSSLVVGCGQEEREPPPSAGTNLVERPSFDGQAAMEFVRVQVGFGPRVPGREGHRAQLAWMIDLLDQWADTVELQPLEFVTSQGETLPLTNLLAKFNPEADDRILLLTHWDTRPWSDQSRDPAEREIPVPGANDGASGTAVLLELARTLHFDPPPIGVDLLFVDGEDYGPGTEDMFIGSEHFAGTIPDPIPWRYGLLLDMVGDRDPRFPVEEHSAEAAPRVVQRVWKVAQELGFGHYFPTRLGMRIEDDHVRLIEAGLPTVDLIDFEYGPGNRLWHTPQDTPENVSSQTLRMVGEVVAELVYRGG